MPKPRTYNPSWLSESKENRRLRKSEFDQRRRQREQLIKRAEEVTGKSSEEILTAAIAKVEAF